MSEKSANEQVQELPRFPTFSLCVLHQLLANLRRLECSICSTTEGDYALVLDRRADADNGCGCAIAIVPRVTGLVFGFAKRDDALPPGTVEVEPILQSDSDGNELLAEVLMTAADVCWNDSEAFADTIAAIARLQNPQFAPFADYLRPLHPRDALEELELGFAEAPQRTQDNRSNQ